MRNEQLAVSNYHLARDLSNEQVGLLKAKC